MRANAESFKSWLLADRGQLEMPGLYQKKSRPSEEQSWYKVMAPADFKFAGRAFLLDPLGVAASNPPIR